MTSIRPVIAIAPEALTKLVDELSARVDAHSQHLDEIRARRRSFLANGGIRSDGFLAGLNARRITAAARQSEAQLALRAVLDAFGLA